MPLRTLARAVREHAPALTLGLAAGAVLSCTWAALTAELAAAALWVSGVAAAGGPAGALTFAGSVFLVVKNVVYIGVCALFLSLVGALLWENCTAPPRHQRPDRGGAASRPAAAPRTAQAVGNGAGQSAAGADTAPFPPGIAGTAAAGLQHGSGGDLVVLLVGHAGHGKDAVCERLAAAHGFERAAFAGPLKRAVAAMFGFSEAQMHDRELKEEVDPSWGVSPRQATNFVGTELVKAHMGRLLPRVGPNFWVVVMLRTIRVGLERARAERRPFRLAISDGRFTEEVAMIRALRDRGLPTLIVRIERPKYASRLADATATHASVLAIDRVPHELLDHVLLNDGSLAQLHAATDRLLRARPRSASQGPAPSAPPHSPRAARH